MNQLLRIAAIPAAIQIVLATLMGVLPGIALSPTPAGQGVRPLTAIQAHGRDVYVREGCSYCHTQQVRPLPVDHLFGRPSAPGDYAYQTPELLGSERTGPDLTNIGTRQPSDIWQYIHLYDPRAVVPESVMPSFPWLFRAVERLPAGATAVPVPQSFAPAGKQVIATADGTALVAYLLALKQAPLATDHDMAAPMASIPAASAEGATLYAASCASCHGAQGAGIPGVFPALVGNAVIDKADPTKHISVILDGLHGERVGGITYAAQMPPFASQLNDQQIAAIADYERTSWGNHAPTVTPQTVAGVRAKH